MNFGFIKEHPDISFFLGLCIIFYFIFFYGIGSYPLMDIDETRYASMASDMFNSKDFMTLYLNGEYFFEKPPLFFWLECLSFYVFGQINEFSVRFPCAFVGTLISFLVYFIGKQIVSRKFGFISAVILATSVEFFVLSKFAILDIVLCFCTSFSIFFGFMTLFCLEKNRKYFWFLFYMFSALAVLAKGIPGFVLPFGIMFFSYIAAKKFKDLFKPVFFLPGVLIFFAIVLPWHFIMLKKYDPLFFNEYIIKHHIARFLTSENLGRKQPFWFFFATILWGFFPWIIPAAANCKIWFSNIIQFFKNGFDFQNSDNCQKFLFLNSIAAIFIFFFFSASSSKLITYILPVYPFLACLTAAIFVNENNQYEKSLKFTYITIGVIFVLIGLIAPIVYLFLDEGLQNFFAAKVPTTFLFTVLGLAILFWGHSKKGIIVTLSLLMLILSSIFIPIGFKTDFYFGQNDLMEYAYFAKLHHNKLASFGFGRRFSLNYYYGKHVIYEQYPLFDNLNNLLKDKNTVIVIKNKDVQEYKKHSRFNVIKIGTKYSLIKG